jgi:hypothetical protein
VIEAWGRGGVRHLDSFHSGHSDNTRIDLYTIPAWTVTRQNKYWAWLKTQLGKKYDWRGVLGFLSRRDAAANQNRWFCSELIHAASVHVGDPLLANIPSRRVTPRDIITSPLLQYSHTVWTDRKTGQNPAIFQPRLSDALGCPRIDADSRASLRPSIALDRALRKMQCRATQIFSQPLTLQERGA